MQIHLTKDILKKQALLLQEVSERIDENTDGKIKITLSSCYHLLAKTYGYESWNELSALLKRTKNLD